MGWGTDIEVSTLCQKEGQQNWCVGGTILDALARATAEFTFRNLSDRDTYRRMASVAMLFGSSRLSMAIYMYRSFFN